MITDSGPDEQTRLRVREGDPTAGPADPAAQGALERLVRLAARLFRVPVAFVAFVDQDRIQFRASVGLVSRHAPRTDSWCELTVQAGDVLVVPDTQNEGRGCRPAVPECPPFRFYAGVPLTTADGRCLGALCLCDPVPHADLDAQDRGTLRDLAASVVEELELRTALREWREAEAVSEAMRLVSPNAIVNLDAGGRIIAWNPAAERLFGVPRTEVLGQSSCALIAQWMGQEVSDQFWTLLSERLVGQSAQTIRVPVCGPPTSPCGGQPFLAEIVLLSVEVLGRRFYTISLRDCTAQKQARAALMSQHNLLRAALDGVPEAMYVKDTERRYLMINAAGAALLERDAAEILGCTDEELFPVVTAQRSRLWDEQVLRTGTAVSYEVDDLLREGLERTFWSNKSAYRDSSGAVAGLIGVSVDITERKLAEAAIRRYNDTLSQRVQDAQIEILDRLTRAAEYRDDDTGEHMTRVGETSAALARELGLPEREVELIRRTAPLHDVGKMGIPDDLLLKLGRLDAQEIDFMQIHTVIGGEILQGGHSALVKMAETIARTHHERWDGQGYPQGLRGLAIPLVGRIVAVADVLDALTAERPYKRAWTLPDALAEMVAQSGRQFDPQVIAALLRLYPDVVLPGNRGQR